MGKSEEGCRMIFHHFVQRSFVNCRPHFLSGLELDGYCRTHELAFEYNGIQHYQYYKKYHRSYRDFERQLERDERKNRLCRQHGLILMTIPHTYAFYNLYPMSVFIYDSLLDAEKQRNQFYIVNRCSHYFRYSSFS